ncbi:MAG: hypothetical protein RLY20_3050 [Verrucomicrobiota bacterium]
MKKLTLCTSLIAALTLFVGCDNSNKPTTPTTNNTPAAAPAPTAAPAPAETAKPVETAVKAVNTTVDATKTAVEKTVTDTKAAATTAATTTVADVTAKFNSIVDQAKTLLGQNKYTDAMNTLQQLANFKLTAEQEKVVSDLKAQIQKAMASKTVSNLLK